MENVNLISLLVYNRNYYVSLHAELTYSNAFSNNFNVEDKSKKLEYTENSKGIFSDYLTINIVERVCNYFTNKKDLEDKKLVLDFLHIDSIQANFGEIFEEFKNLNLFKEIVLINIPFERTNDETKIKKYKEINKEYRSKDEKHYLYYFLNNNKSYSTQSINNHKQVFDIHYDQLLKESFKEINTAGYEDLLSQNDKDSILIDTNNERWKLSHSSSVYYNKFIDLKNLYTYDYNFFILSIYYLAIEITKNTERDWIVCYSSEDLKNQEEKSKAKYILNKDVILFGQNLYSSVITSTLSAFLGTRIMIIDHIGPINKIYHEIEKKIEPNGKYIVVADVVGIGTEVRIAKNIIQFSGGRYIGNASILRIMTMANKTSYTDNHALIYFDQKKNKDLEINFKIRVAIEIETKEL